MKVTLFWLLALLPKLAGAWCFDHAAQRYGMDSALLRAIAQVESGGNPVALGKNADGTEDIGLMQINSRWLPKLASYGIARQDLLDPCTNVQVGAWVLSQNLRRYGYTWRAVGAYNAGKEGKREVYVRRVMRAYGYRG